MSLSPPISRARVIGFTLLLLGIAATSSATDQAVDAGIKVKADAYVTGSWNGILFVIDDAAGFQVRVGTRTEGADFLDGDYKKTPPPGRADHPRYVVPHFYESVTTVGPHAADGSYADLSWNPLFPYDSGSRIRLEWSRVDQTTLLGKVTYASPMTYMSEARTTDVVLEAYSPIGFNAQYSAAAGVVAGRAEYRPTLSEVEWNQWKFRFSSEGTDPHPEAEPGYASGFWKADYDDRSWKTVRWGSYWQEDPFVEKKGFGWYRMKIEIPADMKGKTLSLKLGKVSEKDWTYLNGQRIGATDGSDQDRVYTLAPGSPTYETIRWGEPNVIAVQVFSAAALGGISSGPYGHTPQLEAVRARPPARPRLEALAANPKSVNFVLLSNRRAEQSASFKTIAELEEGMEKDLELGATTGDQAAGLLYRGLHTESLNKSRDNELFFCVKVGTESPESLTAQGRALLDRPDIGDVLAAARAAYEARRVETEGGIAEAAEMITNTLHWATIYAPEQKRSFVVDSRRWFHPDSWALFGNSAVMTAWAAALEDKALAEDTLRGMLIERLPNGMVMNAAGRSLSTPDRSQDMYAAYVAWKIYQKWGDKQFLAEMYPLVKGWHEWWFADRGDGQPWRDANKNGLLELGSNLSPFDEPQAPPESEEYGVHHQGAMWESYDDSPMWGYYQKGPVVYPERYRGDPKVKYLYRTGTLNADVTVTNALFALSADRLVRIAHELGYGPDEERFKQEYAQIKRRINEVLWDDKTGMYLNRFWPEYGGEFSYRKSPVMFFMMAAGVPSPEQARRLVYEHLLNPKEFWGDYVLPTISRDDPTFEEQYYWRGAIWPPMNFFTYEGLTRYGYDEVAASLAEKTFHQVKKNWDTTGALWENYNAITGEGNAHGAGLSTRHYSWSSTLPLLAIMDTLDTDTWHDGLRFGSMGATEENRVFNLPIRGVNYGATAGPHLTELSREGRRIFHAAAALRVSRFLWQPEHVTFQYKTGEGSGTVQCSLNGLSRAAKPPAIRVDGTSVIFGRYVEDGLVLELPPGEHGIEVSF